MSTSTTLSFPTLPPTIQRPELHEKRSNEAEAVKLANQVRAFLNGVYESSFDFETPGDNVFKDAWKAQLQDTQVWYVSADISATSSAGDGAGWRRDTLITRSGLVVTVVNDVSTAHLFTASLINFDVQWAVSGLYAVLQLKDDVAVPGKWTVRLQVVPVPRGL